MKIEFLLPIKGYSEGLSPHRETTSSYMMNVRPRDVLENKLRIGQRPGFDKKYSQQISGDAVPIIWLGDVTIVD